MNFLSRGARDRVPQEVFLLHVFDIVSSVPAADRSPPGGMRMAYLRHATASSESCFRLAYNILDILSILSNAENSYSILSHPNYATLSSLFVFLCDRCHAIYIPLYHSPSETSSGDTSCPRVLFCFRLCVLGQPTKDMVLASVIFVQKRDKIASR